MLQNIQNTFGCSFLWVWDGSVVVFNLHLAQVSGGLTATLGSHENIMIQWKQIKGAQ